jgi:hypothetical protein
MRGFGYIAVLIALFVMLFGLVDSPVNAARRLVGMPAAEDDSRQAVMGLALSLDLSGRREGRRIAVLIDDWLYCYPETGDVFLVPRGYETDFASIPPSSRWLIEPFGNHAEAAVVHDWLYAVGEEGKREEADKVFRYAMKEQGVNLVKRNTMFAAVRAGGGNAYGQDKEWRFKDPATFQLADAPFEKPAKAAVATIDCESFAEQISGLLEAHGT